MGCSYWLVMPVCSSLFCIETWLFSGPKDFMFCEWSHQKIQRPSSPTCSLCPAYLSFTCGHGLVDLSYFSAREAQSTLQRADLIRSIDLQQVTLLWISTAWAQKELHIFCAAFNKYSTYRSPSKPPLTPLGFISCRSLCFVVKALGKSFKCWKYSHSSLQTPHEVSTTGKSFPGLWEDLGRASFQGWTVEPSGPSDPSVNGDTKAYQKSILKRAKCHSQYYPFHTCNTLLKGKYSSLLLLLSFHPSLFRLFSLSWLSSSCSRGFIPGWHPFGISHKYTVARGCYLAVPK